MRPLRGIILKLCAVANFIVMASLIKSVSDHVPAGQSVFFRSFFAIPIILAWLAWQHKLKTGLRAKSPWSHFRRGVSGTLAMGCGFAGLAFLPLPEVTAIGYAAPLLTVVFAALILHEQIRAFRITSVLIGLTGVLIVIAPRLSIETIESDPLASFGALVVLFGAVFTALAQISIRAMINTETTSAIVFYFSVTAAVLSLLTLPFGWVWPSPGTAAILVCAGLIGGVGQIFLTSCYREADASVVAPFDYASILFAIAIGYWIFDETPTLSMLVGASIVVFAGILIIWRERQLGLERTRPRKAMTPQG
ncbi:MAG: DMT family transporter [Pseudorhodobacter sp.]